MRYTLVFMLLVISIAFSGTVTQTDWSGGSGVQGPTIDWGDTFYSTDGNLLIIGGILTMDIQSITPIENIIDSSFNRLRGAYYADIDNDGDMDVLAADEFAYTITWWENVDGIGTSWTGNAVDDNVDQPFSVHAVDIDNDGDMDVLGGATNDNEIIWWENSDSGSAIYWTTHIINDNFEEPYSVYSADIDGDGDIDVLGSSAVADGIAWWENTDGAGTSWTEHTVDGNYDETESVYSADIDGDGDMDVLGAAWRANHITWWENTDGTGTSWTEHTIDGDFGGAYSVHAADVNSDGYMDVLGAAYNDEEITWWENTDGTGTSWTEHVVAGNFVEANSVYAADIDNDGDMDVLGTGDDELAWFENLNGYGIYWTKHTLDGNFNTGQSVCAVDIDCDDYMDILGTSVGGDELVWWKVFGYPSVGILESSILDLDRLPEWDDISCILTEPTGTSVGFQVRSSDNYTDMGTWSDTIFTSGTSLSGILDDSTQYVQYRVTIETNNPSYSAILEDVSLSFIELITVLTPNEYTVWTQNQENVVISWDYEADKSLLAGDSVSIDLYKGASLIANLSGGDIPDSGAFTYPGPIPTGWVPGLDYRIVITDNADNYGSGDDFEIRAFTAIEEMSATAIFSAELMPFSPNPVRGLVSASIAVPESDIVNLSIYDVTGRMVRNSSGAIDAGYHSIELGELNQGIYFCRMVTEDYTSIQKFVVIE